jgi:hypothetical protein
VPCKFDFLEDDNDFFSICEQSKRIKTKSDYTARKISMDQATAQRNDRSSKEVILE